LFFEPRNVLAHPIICRLQILIHSFSLIKPRPKLSQSQPHCHDRLPLLLSVPPSRNNRPANWRTQEAPMETFKAAETLDLFRPHCVQV
jgi:hypothetical protein